MSKIRISDLPEKIDNLNDEDIMIIEDSEDTKKISLIKLRSIFSMDGILTSMKDMLLEKIESFVETHSVRYKELLSRNEDLEVICHNLNNEHIHDAERIFKLEDEVLSHQKNVSDLKEEKNRLLALLAQLDLDKDSMAEKIISLSNQLDSNDKSITILKSQVKDIQLKNKILKENNEILQNQIDILEQESSDKIDQSFNSIQNIISENIEDLIAYIRYYHPDVDNILGGSDNG